jgi:peptide/nickel transport system permease protein
MSQLERKSEPKVRLLDPRESWIGAVLHRFFRNKTARIGLAILTAIVLAAIFASAIAPFDPIKQNPRDGSKPPSSAHYFGTDRFGRDIFSRTVVGGRLSLQAGILSVVVAALLGIVPGLLAGYYGGWIDGLIGRVVDVFLAFPSILLALAIVAALGPGLYNVQLAIGVSLAPSFFRLVRSCVIAAKESVYVEAARALGATDYVVLSRHLLINIIGPVVVMTTVALGWAMVIAASLNFLGMGVQPPIPEWGADLALGRDHMRTAWWISAFPGMFIMMTILSINLVGDGLRDAIDPRLEIR